MQKHLFLPAILCLFAITSFGQGHMGGYRPKNDFSNEVDNGSLGIGAGFDYGGLGLNFLVYPQKNIGLFAGVGYALAGFGYNVGLKLRLNPEGKQAVPYMMVMYGYNAAIAVVNNNNFGYGSSDGSLDKVFYGPTIGFGVDVKSRRVQGFWSFTLMIPFRGSDVDDYMNYLTNTYGVSFDSKPLPIGLSIGYHWVLF